MIQVFSALTALRPFPFNRQHNFSGGTAIGVASPETSYPGCSIDQPANEGSEEPPGSRTGEDSEPPDAYYYAHSKSSYRAFSLEQALTNKWLKIAVKAAFLVAVAATCKSAPRTRTINDLLDDYGIPLAKYLMERLKNRGGVFAAKAQAGYTELSSDPSALELITHPSLEQSNPIPETLASDIDPEQLTIIPVGEQLNLESLPPNVSNLLEITAQPAGDVVDSVAVADVATITPPDVGSVLELAAHVAHAVHQSTL